MKALSVILLSLLIVFTGCQLPVATDAGQSGVVLVAVGSGGMIARMVIPVGNPNLPPSKILNGDYVFGGNVRVLGAFNQGSQQANVNVAAAGGTIGSATNPFFGNEYVRGTLYQQLGQQWVGPITNPFQAGPDTIQSVAFGNGVFVAGANNGKIARSVDFGATWGAYIANNFGGAETIQSIAFGSGVFVAVSSLGNTSRSTDNGVTWSALVNVNGVTPILGVAFGNGIFNAIQSGARLLRSTDLGQSWSTTTPFTPHTGVGISYGNGVFVVVGTVAITYRSPDLGVTWSLSANPFGANNLRSTAFGNGIFVATSDVGTIARSVDLGLTWGSLITNPFAVTVLNSSSYNFGIFQIGATNGTTARSYDNGLTWGSLITNPFGANAIYSIASSTSNIVAVGQAGSIATAGWNAVFSSAPEQLYVPTFTNWGVVVTTSIAWRMVANRVKIMGNFTTPAGAAGEARMSLPNGMISDAALVPNLRVAGIIISNTAAAAAFYCLIESGVGYITFGAEAAGVAGLTKQTGAALFPAGAIVSLQVEIPISGANV